MRIVKVSLLFAAVAVAQTPYGSIVGRVVDRGQALVAGAGIRAVNLSTQVATAASSNNEGNYIVPNLLPGQYRVEVEKPGFKRFTREPVDVRLGDRLTLDVALEIGEMTQSITITSEVPLLESTTATVGQVIDHRRLTDLPVPSSSVIFQLALTPGIVPLGAPSGNWSPDTEGNTDDFAVSGAGGSTNLVSIDGNPNDNRGCITIHPIPEMVEEVRVQTTAIDASVGRVTGAYVNMVMKSGTNALHADGLWAYLGRPLTAMDFFAKRHVYNPATGPVTDAKKRAAWPGSVMKRYRGSASGPVWIPKLYDGRNRTFWTFGFEKMKSYSTKSGVFTTPTAEERNGDFTRLLAIGAQYQLYDPATIAPAAAGRYSRQPLAGNRIPASRIDAAAKLLLPYYPIANTAGTVDGIGNFVYPDVSPQGYDSEMGRVDHVISQSQRLFVSFTRKYHDHNYNPLGTGAFSSVMDRKQHGFTIADSLTPRPDLVIDLRFGFTRWGDERFSKTRGFDLSTLGLPSALVSQLDRAYTTLPRLAISGYGTIGGGAQAGAATTYKPWQSQDLNGQVMHTRGNHSLRAGAEFRVVQENNTNLGHVSPSYTFAETWTRGPLDNSPVPPIGAGLASFMLGLPTGGSIDSKDTSAATSKYTAVFLQDDWKVSRRLTVNVGLRYEIELPTTERFNRTVIGYDFTTANPIQAAAQANYARNPIAEVPVSAFRTMGGLVFAGGGNPRGMWDPDRNNLAPRIGLAYMLRPNTVLRAGYAIFFDHLGVDAIGVYQPGYTQSTALTPSLDNGITFRATTQNPFPDGILKPAGSSKGLATYLGSGVTAVRRDLAHPYMQRWSLNVQQALPFRATIDVGYIGSRGVGMRYSQALNAIPAQYLSTSPVRDQATIDYLSQAVKNPFSGLAEFTGTSLATANVARSQLLRPYPQFTSISGTASDGYSWYHALQARVEKRLSSGFTGTAAYTWSKSMGATSRLNESDLLPYRTISSFDRTHNVTISAMYDLPFGSKRRFLSGIRWLNPVVGGWSLQALYIGQSGAPLEFGNVIFTGDLSNILLSGKDRTVDRWFNTGAGFERSSSKQLGSNIRTFPMRLSGVRTDGINCANISLFKNFTFRERLNVQLRAEATNAFNHSMFLAQPNTTPTSTQFGAMTGIGSSNLPRRVTLGAKVSW